MTFSLVARCARTGMFGVVISSSSPAVAARCAFARAGVGAVATQNVTDPRLGPLALDLMERGATAAEAMAILRRRAAYVEYRQVLAIDALGSTCIHSGPNALGVWAEAEGQDCAAGGNLLAHAGVPQAMVAGFAAASGHLAARLMAALQAGLAAGGEAGPVHSAGLKVVDRHSWPLVDLRCDWTEDCPVAALSLAWDVYAPQSDAYVQRALDPRAAPSYGVPGDA
ncbi:DUF1028 domain-containing protein [Phaeovulum sp. W22_SRMD_FR3]|uniref:DUF1028 domain-containing protein n=1 Tax=Phaeovulum sp. W22_SRMD_FR3 TaxID=3240274 RepID=UPI003F9BF53C